MALKKKEAIVGVPTKLEREADLVMGTNNSSIVSKRSVEMRYFPQHQFFRHFVKKPQRRAPLINRGYWLRMHAIAQTVRRFLEEPSDVPKYVLNLGCGYDPLPFQFLRSEQSLCRNATFVDIDYEKLMGIKTAVIQQTTELLDIIGDAEVYPELNVIRMRASHYIAVGCDLKNLKKLDEGLRTVFGSSPASILCIAEVSLTYMDIESADALVSWLPQLGEDVRFCLLEQFFPDGPDHPFAATMMKHFHKLQAPLHSIHRYPSLRAQENRFIDNGWRHASARSLWHIWNDNSFVDSSQRMTLDTVEPFDEWEEFSLFASHYFLLSASTRIAPYSQPEDVSPPESPSNVSLRLRAHCWPGFSGQRRFGAIVPDSKVSVGVHGGLGRQSRLLSTDVYVESQQVAAPIHTLPPPAISARMCHTITAIRDGECLLVGGRTSPTAALSDCWIRQGQRWQPTDPLPTPRFRHCATRVHWNNTEHILVFGGKSKNGDTLSEWLLWHAQKGWQRIEVKGDTKVPKRFGACMESVDNHSGYLFGGMSNDGVLLSDFWFWKIVEGDDGSTTVQVVDQTRNLHGSTTLSTFVSRFGATTNMTSNGLLIVGGIGVHGVLPAEVEILLLDIGKLTPNVKPNIMWNSTAVCPIGLGLDFSGPRPLLTGHVSWARDSSEVLILGGGGVCFSFGTFWNNGVWTLQDAASKTQNKWLLLPGSGKSEKSRSPSLLSENLDMTDVRKMTPIPKREITTKAEFEEILAESRPVVIRAADLGSCTEKWSKDYLTRTVGSDRKVVVHEARSDHLNFQKKNFSYVTKDFGTFLEEVYNGSRQYLRSISADQPSKKVANLGEDFPGLKDDFQLPPQLEFAHENAHSSPLRISGPVTMWLHYDVMANVLCQVQGQKKLILYPPSDVQHLQLEAGASSSNLDIFHGLSDGQVLSVPHTSPFEATLTPGDILFIPPLWLHTTSPIGGVSIAVNVFFRNLTTGYAAGRDVYANRDLQAYEKGRSDVQKIARSFDGLPPDMAQFYLLRLAEELRSKASGS